MDVSALRPFRRTIKTSPDERREVEAMDVDMKQPAGFVPQPVGHRLATASAGQHWCQIVKAGEQLAMRSSLGSLLAVSEECIAHSQLLQELVSSGANGEVAPVPVSEEAFSLWMQCVNATDSTQTSTHSPRVHYAPEAVLVPLVDPVVALAAAPGLGHIIMASDVLIDDATKHTVADRLAFLLQQDEARALSFGMGQVMAQLPEHLTLSILSRVPLEHVLEHLPASFHPPSLRAHHPSIDAHHYLHLHLILPDLMHAALTATTALDTLQELSLHGATLPHACESCIGVLLQLTSVTALNLRDVGITAGTAAALAAVLPAVQQLRSLDLSYNRVTAAVVTALRTGLSRCTSLQALHMLRWVVADDHIDKSIIQDVLAVLASLHQLTALSFGVDYLITNFTRNAHPMTDHLPDFQRAINSMPNLVQLQLDCAPLSDSAGLNVAPVLYASPRLHRLLLRPPNHSEPTPTTVLGCAVGTLTLLTSLELHVGGTFYKAAPHFMQSIAALPMLCALRLLASAGISEVLQDSFSHIAAAVAEALPHMTQLMQLHVLADRDTEIPDPDDGTPQLDDAPARRLVQAAAAAPQLLELRLPVRLTAYEAPLVAQLLEATKHLQLALSLCLQCDLTECQLSTELLPLTTHLALRGSDDVDAGPHVLQPLVEAGPALGTLCVLDVRLQSAHDSHTSEQLQALLNSVSCMTGLRRLRVEAEGVKPILGRGSRDRLDIAQFCHGLHSLRELTRLHWDVRDEQRGDVGQGEVLRACRLLPGLRELKLRSVADAPVFVAVVPKLPLRRLQLLVLYVALQAEDVAGVLTCLPHLREACLATPPPVFANDNESDEADDYIDEGWDSEIESLLRDSVSELPACCLCMHDNPDGDSAWGMRCS